MNWTKELPKEEGWYALLWVDGKGNPGYAVCHEVFRFPLEGSKLVPERRVGVLLGTKRAWVDNPFFKDVWWMKLEMPEIPDGV